MASFWLWNWSEKSSSLLRTNSTLLKMKRKLWLWLKVLLLANYNMLSKVSTSLFLSWTTTQEEKCFTCLETKNDLLKGRPFSTLVRSALECFTSTRTTLFTVMSKYFYFNKPENILIDANGYLRIADFGLSKPLISRDEVTFSFCGSPEYMAPEMLLQYGHN